MIIKKITLLYSQLGTRFANIYNVSLAQGDIPSADAVDVISKDLPRSVYVDLDGRTTAEMQKKWITKNKSGALQLAPNISTDFIQGNLTAEVVASLIVAQTRNNLFQEDKFTQYPTIHELSFSYINAKGKPAGISIAQYTAELQDGSIETRWLASTIQNTNAPQEQRKVAMLASANFTDVMNLNNEQNVAMENTQQFRELLRAMIENDKITALVQDIFNTDGSLNIKHLTSLKKRLVVNGNIDDRDHKKAQLDFLKNVATKLNDEALLTDIDHLLQQGLNDINFFADAKFIPAYEEILGKTAQAIANRQEQINPQCITANLKELAQKYAKNSISVFKVAPESIQKPSYSTQPSQLVSPEKSFLTRNSKEIGFGLGSAGIIAGVGITLALLSIFPPLAILVAASAVLFVVATVVVGKIAYNGNQAQKQLAQYETDKAQEEISQQQEAQKYEKAKTIYEQKLNDQSKEKKEEYEEELKKNKTTADEIEKEVDELIAPPQKDQTFSLQNPSAHSDYPSKHHKQKLSALLPSKEIEEPQHELEHEVEHREGLKR